jgi:hypothetical protein
MGPVQLSKLPDNVWKHIEEVFVVFTGETERSDGSPFMAFSTEDDAARHAANRGIWGGSAPYRKMNAIVIDGWVFLIANNTALVLDETPADAVAKKAAALAKLTDEEKRILGVG